MCLIWAAMCSRGEVIGAWGGMGPRQAAGWSKRHSSTLVTLEDVNQKINSKAPQPGVETTQTLSLGPFRTPLH